MGFGAKNQLIQFPGKWDGSAAHTVENRVGFRERECNYAIRQLYTSQGQKEAHGNAWGVYPDEMATKWKVAPAQWSNLPPLTNGFELWNGGRSPAGDLKADL